MVTSVPHLIKSTLKILFSILFYPLSIIYFFVCFIPLFVRTLGLFGNSPEGKLPLIDYFLTINFVLSVEIIKLVFVVMKILLPYPLFPSSNLKSFLKFCKRFLYLVGKTIWKQTHLRLLLCKIKEL